jgi:hypothetical protein
LDESASKTLLIGERLHHRTDAEQPLCAADADTSFCAATRTSPD